MEKFADKELTPSAEEQTAFNIAHWAELSADPQWEHWEGRIETDEFGNAILIPIAPPIHGRALAQIALHLQQILGGSGAIACPVSTTKGVKCSDVVWMPREAWDEVRDEPCLPTAPAICIEVRSPNESLRELVYKKALYFQAGAVEVWFCDRKGKMTFFLSLEDDGSDASRLCPAIPASIGM